jgi:hypothetical protein
MQQQESHANLYTNKGFIAALQYSCVLSRIFASTISILSIYWARLRLEILSAEDCRIVHLKHT